MAFGIVPLQKRVLRQQSGTFQLENQLAAFQLENQLGISQSMN